MQSVGAPLSRWQSTQSLILSGLTWDTLVMLATSPWQVEHTADGSIPSLSEKNEMCAS